MSVLPWREVAGGIELRVRAQPKARKPGVTGLVDSADGRRLRVAVTAPPEDGRANRAVIEAVADVLGVAPSRLTLLAGASAREKTILVQGDPAMLRDLAARSWGEGAG